MKTLEFILYGHCLACGEPSLLKRSESDVLECCRTDECGARYEVREVRPPRWQIDGELASAARER